MLLAGALRQILKEQTLCLLLRQGWQAVGPRACWLAYGYYSPVLGTRQALFANIFTVTGAHNFLSAYVLKGRGQPENFDFLKLYVHNTHYNYHMEQLPWPAISN